MIKLFKRDKTEATSTQELIDAANSALFGMDVDSEEYSKTLDQIERLHKLASREKEGRRVSPDTLALVLGNLVGIIIILNFEKVNVIGTKAIGMIVKPKN